jgi:ribonuclease D
MKRLSKAQISELPNYQGLTLENIRIVESEQDAAYAISVLSNEKVIGFDTESKPTFKKGEKSAGPTLIQLATASQGFLFPTRFTCAVAAAQKILSDSGIKKVGFGLKGDRKELHSKLEIELVNSQDLAVELRKMIDDKNDIGAKAAVAMVLGQRLLKGAQLSNWGAYPLKKQQVEYAANDAHAAICVANKISI